MSAEHVDDIQSASSNSSTSALGSSSGELINLSDAESVSKGSKGTTAADKPVDRDATPVKMFDVDTPPPAPDFYRRHPPVPTSSPMPEPADAVNQAASSAPVPVDLNRAAELDELDAETRRYIVQHGARSQFDSNYKKSPSPPVRSESQSPPAPIIAVAGAEFGFPKNSDACSPSAEHQYDPISFPTGRLASVQLDPETLAREQRAYIIEQGVRSGYPNQPGEESAPSNAAVQPTAPAAPSHSDARVVPSPLHEPVGPAAPTALDALVEKATMISTTNTKSEAEDRAPEGRDRPASGDVAQPFDVGGSIPLPHTATTTSNMIPNPIQAFTGEETPKAEDVPNPMDKVAHVEHTKAFTKAKAKPMTTSWDGNLPRRTAIATLFGAIAAGLYKASLESDQRSAFVLGCAWFAVAAVSMLQPTKKLVSGKDWTDLTFDTSAKVLAVALVANLLKQ